jgi:hypothetical protein
LGDLVAIQVCMQRFSAALGGAEEFRNRVGSFEIKKQGKDSGTYRDRRLIYLTEEFSRQPDRAALVAHEVFHIFDYYSGPEGERYSDKMLLLPDVNNSPGAVTSSPAGPLEDVSDSGMGFLFPEFADKQYDLHIKALIALGVSGINSYIGSLQRNTYVGSPRYNYIQSIMR